MAATVGALSVLAMYSAGSIETHVAVMKWVFFPASIAWTVATVWFVAFYAEVRPKRFLAVLTAGFGVALVLDLLLPGGMLHHNSGKLVPVRILDGVVMVASGSSPHALHYLTDVLTVTAFAFLCYAVYHVFRRHQSARAGYLAFMTVLLALATLLDTINEHSIITSFTTLYLTQVCFAVVILTGGLALRRESLRVEKELRHYRTEMESLVAARVVELDHANVQLALEARERRATAEALRRRVAELDALQRIARILAARKEMGEALGEAAHAMGTLFAARYVGVHLVMDDDKTVEGVAARTGAAGAPAVAAGDREGTASVEAALVAAVADRALRESAMIAQDVARWPGLPDELRRAAAADGIGHVLAAPLVAASGQVGALVIARGEDGAAFSTDDQQVAKTAGEAVAAAIEIDRLHRAETKQAAEEERQALARDLHDAVTQSIYSASLIAEALPAVWEREPAEGLRNLERMRRLVRAALAEMRTLLFELRPASLAAAPIGALIDRLGDSLGGQMQIPVEIVVDDVDLPPEVKLAFYRVTQEAFSNIAKQRGRSASRPWSTGRATWQRSWCATTAEASTRAPSPAATWACSSCASVSSA